MGFKLWRYTASGKLPQTQELSKIYGRTAFLLLLMFMSIVEQYRTAWPSSVGFDGRGAVLDGGGASHGMVALLRVCRSRRQAEALQAVSGDILIFFSGAQSTADARFGESGLHLRCWTWSRKSVSRLKQVTSGHRPTVTPMGPGPGSQAYRFIPSESCAAASIFDLPWTMTSLAVSPRIQQSTMSAQTCMRTRRGPDNRAWLYAAATWSFFW